MIAESPAEQNSNPLRHANDGSLGFCYESDEAVFAGALGASHGPLLIGLDTNAVLELQQYGLKLIDEEPIDHPDEEHLRDIHALGDLVELWFLRDIRFVVLPAARTDRRRPGDPARKRQLYSTLAAIEDALSFQLNDWGSEGERFAWYRSRSEDVASSLARIPGALDRTLVEQSYDCGVDVFLTMDKQLLRSAARTPQGFPNVWRPSTLMDRLASFGVGFLAGGNVDHEGCPYSSGALFPDTGRMSRLLSVL